jgi:hypothetical protein
MIIPELQGGLGNVLFQLSASYSIAKQTGHEFGIYHIPMPPENHSKVNYSKTILKPWLQYTVSYPATYSIRQAGNGAFTPVNEFKQYPRDSVLYLSGYWQYYEYIEPYKTEILSMIDLNTDIISMYTDITDAYFLHVRRGDYVGNQYYELDLQSYYKKGVERIGTGIAYIVSNDIPWCETWSYLDDVRHRIIQENDVDTISLMAHCKKGGIAANSTFSWWGLYLDTNRPNLIIPNKWYTSDYLHNFEFPGVIVETI